MEAKPQSGQGTRQRMWVSATAGRSCKLNRLRAVWPWKRRPKPGVQEESQCFAGRLLPSEGIDLPSFNRNSITNLSSGRVSKGTEKEFRRVTLEFPLPGRSQKQGESIFPSHLKFTLIQSTHHFPPKPIIFFLSPSQWVCHGLNVCIPPEFTC